MKHNCIEFGQVAPLMRWIILVAASAAMCSPLVAAEEDRPSGVKHPVLAHDINLKNAAAYEKAAAPIMAMSEAEMLKLIPTRSGVMFCGCPNCDGGQQQNGQFDWSIDRPTTLRCKYCGHEYPSEKYPANRTDKGLNMLDEPVEYRYYFDEKTGRRASSIPCWPMISIRRTPPPTKRSRRPSWP
jgi:hypothetical protein